MLGHLLAFQPMKHECQKTKERDDKAAQLTSHRKPEREAIGHQCMHRWGKKKTKQTTTIVANCN